MCAQACALWGEGGLSNGRCCLCTGSKRVAFPTLTTLFLLQLCLLGGTIPGNDKAVAGTPHHGNSLFSSIEDTRAQQTQCNARCSTRLYYFSARALTFGQVATWQSVMMATADCAGRRLLSRDGMESRGMMEVDIVNMPSRPFTLGYPIEGTGDPSAPTTSEPGACALPLIMRALPPTPSCGTLPCKRTPAPAPMHPLSSCLMQCTSFGFEPGAAHSGPSCGHHHPQPCHPHAPSHYTRSQEHIHLESCTHTLSVQHIQCSSLRTRPQPSYMQNHTLLCATHTTRPCMSPLRCMHLRVPCLFNPGQMHSAYSKTPLITAIPFHRVHMRRHSHTVWRPPACSVPRTAGLGCSREPNCRRDARLLEGGLARCEESKVIGSWGGGGRGGGRRRGGGGRRCCCRVYTV